MRTYPSACFVVMKIHEGAGQARGVSGMVLLPLAHINEALGESVSVLAVVAAAAPDPIPMQDFGP